VALLTSGRAGLPAYHYAGRYHTLALPLRRCTLGGLSEVQVRPARVEDLPALLGLLAEVGPRRQFFPVYQTEDFFTSGGAFRDLKPEDILLAERGGRLVGMLGAWDQQSFRQTVIQSYHGPLRWLRPLYNGWAWLRGRPTLPRPGSPFHYLTAALPVVAGDDPQVFGALLGRMGPMRGGGPQGHLLLGLHEADPLLPVAREFRPACYTTLLYLVCWEDGEGLRGSLDGRPPYLELGSL
jgi:hypothetical protein